jgi:pimeloyl-ACP methyl ester carboxylesterase
MSVNGPLRRIFCVALLAACLSPLPSSADAKPASNRVESGVVKLADSNIEYFSQGQGQPVVLLPGGSLTVGYMDGLAQSLAEAGYRAVRINFRGSGKSTGSGKDVTLHTLAADFAGVIEALKLQPANVAGHAFGNRVARMLAADRPELVRSVILFAAGGKVAPEPAVEQALVAIFNPESSEAQVMEAMRYMVGNPAHAASVWKIVAPCRAPTAAGVERTAMESTPLKDWWAPPGPSKYLVLQGTNDQAAPPANGDLLKQELGARVTVVPFPGAGHLMLVEEPQKAAAAIISFLRPF